VSPIESSTSAIATEAACDESQGGGSVRAIWALRGGLDELFGLDHLERGDAGRHRKIVLGECGPVHDRADGARNVVSGDCANFFSEFLLLDQAAEPWFADETPCKRLNFAAAGAR
jgi:hypothetical protein